MTMNSTTPIRFKADTSSAPYIVNYNNRYTPSMPEGSNAAMDDVFMTQLMEQQKAQKKEKSKENWNKAGIIAQAGIAVAFLGMLAVSILGLKKSGNGEAAKKELEALTKVNITWEE